MNMDNNSRTLQEDTDLHGEIPGVSIRVYRSRRLLKHKNKCCFIIWIFRLDNMLKTGSFKVSTRYINIKLFYAFWNETLEVLFFIR